MTPKRDHSKTRPRSKQQAAFLAQLRDKGLGLAPVVNRSAVARRGTPADRAGIAAPVDDLTQKRTTLPKWGVRPAKRLTELQRPDRAIGHTGEAEFTLWIPAPAEWLNLNHRLHWHPKNERTQAWRTETAKQARLQLMPKHWGRVEIEIFTVKPTARSYDAHNLILTGKAIVDGLIDWQMCIDDSNEFVTGPDMRPGGKGMPGVFVVIRQLPHAHDLPGVAA